MAKFVDTTCAACFARQNPVSTSAKPACMKMTSTAPRITQSRFTWTPSAAAASSPLVCAPAGAAATNTRIITSAATRAHHVRSRNRLMFLPRRRGVPRRSAFVSVPFFRCHARVHVSCSCGPPDGKEPLFRRKVRVMTRGIPVVSTRSEED